MICMRRDCFVPRKDVQNETVFCTLALVIHIAHAQTKSTLK